MTPDCRFTSKLHFSTKLVEEQLNKKDALGMLCECSEAAQNFYQPVGGWRSGRSYLNEKSVARIPMLQKSAGHQGTDEVALAKRIGDHKHHNNALC